MRQYLWKLRYIVAVKVSTCFLSIIGIASMPYILKLLLDQDFRQGGISALLLTAAYGGAVVMGMGFEYISQKYSWKLEQHFNILVKKDLFDSILSWDDTEFRKKEIAEYVSLFTNDIPVYSKYMECWIQIIQWILQLFVYSYFLFSMDWRLALLIISSSVVSLSVPKMTGSKLSKKKAEHLQGQALYTEVLQDLLSGFRLINNETRQHFVKRHEDSLKTTEEKLFLYGKQNTFTNVLTGSSMYALQIMVFAVIAFLLWKQQITVGTASAAIGYIIDFCYPVSYILRDINTINASRSAKDKIVNLIQKRKTERPSLERFEEEISFENVSVHLGDYYMPAFTRRFEKGKKYAIIGASGSGKSTILNLLMQYIKADSGQILIDGKEISGYDSSGIMLCINQFEHVFHATFRENASLFDTYPEEQLETARAYFNNDKLNSLMEIKNARELSGGEVQMMQLLRTLAVDKEILLLDESLSAIDRNNGELLKQALLALNKTILFVTHDCSEDTLKQFDEVILIERNREQEGEPCKLENLPRLAEPEYRC